MAPPQSFVYTVDNVQIYKTSDFVKESEAMNVSEYAFYSEQSKTFFVDASNNISISATAHEELLQLVEKKMLVWKGKGRARYYVFKRGDDYSFVIK
ncbi:hypothetical protein FP803_05095 [Candidatus Woesearchaeota archaeon]|nr:hypothetical protein [Candidatus Woesearchaeota archaeon]MBU3941772.1 hypothetical protein [Nanoarchaeota archaeon]